MRRYFKAGLAILLLTAAAGQPGKIPECKRLRLFWPLGPSISGSDHRGPSPVGLIGLRGRDSAGQGAGRIRIWCCHRLGWVGTGWQGPLSRGASRIIRGPSFKLCHTAFEPIDPIEQQSFSLS